MKTAAPVPDPTFEEVDRAEAHRTENITEALDRIFSQEDSSLDPVLAALQTRALSRDDW